MGISKEITLKKFFLKYLLTIVSCILLSFVIPWILIGILSNYNVVRPANYYEIEAKKIKPKLERLSVIKQSDIPKNLSYIIFDKNNNIESTNLKSEQVQDALNFIDNKNDWKINYFVYIKGKSNSCILKYKLKVSYTSNRLNEIFLSPEKMIYIFIIINLLISCVISIIIFSRKLKTELIPLLNTTKQIHVQNLDFIAERSKIKEFNEILDSVIDMRDELKDTLKKKWEEEKIKTEQLSALSHDIKTPLTIIKGNTQLLLESDSLEEDKEYGEFILNGANEIENYISILSNAIHNGRKLRMQRNKVNINNLLSKIEKDTLSLFQTKEINLKSEYLNIPNFIYGDEQYIYRAIMNVLSNAFDYSPRQGTVYFNIFSRDEYLYFKITDEGKGFSQNDIKNASNMFYQGDKSRSRNNHYGIGLYLVNVVAKEHRGEVILGNSKETLGAEVIFKIKSH